MKIGYIRVSTTVQNIDRQVDALKDAGCEKIFIDKITGARADRPELLNMFDHLRAGDTVIVTELSRFGRSTKDLIALMERLNSMNVNIQSLKETFINTTTIEGRFIYTLFAALAEFDREIRRAYAKEGIQAARARGRTGGRPPIDDKKKKLAIQMYTSKKFTIQQIVEASGISQGTLYKYLKDY